MSNYQYKTHQWPEIAALSHTINGQENPILEISWLLLNSFKMMLFFI